MEVKSSLTPTVIKSGEPLSNKSPLYSQKVIHSQASIKDSSSESSDWKITLNVIKTSSAAGLDARGNVIIGLRNKGYDVSEEISNQTFSSTSSKVNEVVITEEKAGVYQVITTQTLSGKLIENQEQGLNLITTSSSSDVDNLSSALSASSKTLVLSSSEGGTSESMISIGVFTKIEETQPQTFSSPQGYTSIFSQPQMIEESKYT